MGTNHVLSVGTSIFINLKRYFQDVISEEEIDSFKNLDIKNENLIEEKAKNLVEKIENKLERETIGRLSAEINGIDSISPPIDNEKDSIFLLSTNTPEGLVASYINKFIFEKVFNFPSDSIKIIKIKGTDVKRRYNIFKEHGIPNIFNTIAKIKEESDKENKKLYIYVSGGYKPISTMLTVAGLILNVELLYKYEQGDLIRIPNFPIGINWENLDDKVISIFRKVFKQELLSDKDKEEIKINPMLRILIVTKKDGYKVSELGYIVYKNLVNELFIFEDSDIFVLKRDSFEKFTEKIFQKKKNNYMIAVFDLDKFKRINDTFGHNIGDKALRVFANTIDSVSYKNRMFGRIGGDEFMGIFWDIQNKEEAQQILEELLSEVKSTSLIEERIDNKEKEKFYLSTTIGAYLFNTDKIEDLNLEDLKKKADDELTKLKDKNQRGKYIFLSDIS